MTKTIDFVADLNERYAALELDLDEKLKNIVQPKLKHHEGGSEFPNEDRSQSSTVYHIPKATQPRNHNLIKSLEISKARLRSRATFSPLETILQKAIENYLKESALIPSNTIKAYGPTY
ncbi:uncharacterized protein LOC128274015 [Anopheles cruzii]|uniref:uncharacterized protein LOC128274015 n=1 Tax=Anopheles cruzii TaxID=68878 RepID=UPI0022EC90F5|nr:uncharacterized protein LOC128274015 [Anopheles cruzii]